MSGRSSVAHPTDQGLMLPVTVHVRTEADITVAQVKARRFAESVGVGRRGQWELAIATSEMASNIFKYVGVGRIELRVIADAVEVRAIDNGGGIHEIPSALEDGISEGVHVIDGDHVRDRRGLGLGFGAIRRLTDSLTVHNREEGGLEVIVTKRIA